MGADQTSLKSILTLGWVWFHKFKINEIRNEINLSKILKAEKIWNFIAKANMNSPALTPS